MPWDLLVFEITMNAHVHFLSIFTHIKLHSIHVVIAHCGEPDIISVLKYYLI